MVKVIVNFDNDIYGIKEGDILDLYNIEDVENDETMLESQVNTKKLMMDTYGDEFLGFIRVQYKDHDYRYHTLKKEDVEKIIGVYLVDKK